MGAEKIIKLTDEECKELEAKLEAFEKSVEERLVSSKEALGMAYEAGDYNYLVEEYNVNIDHVELSESLQELIDLKILTKEEVIEESLEKDYLEANYEEQSNPRQYGRPDENEVYTTDLGEIQEQLEYEKEFDISESLKLKFANKSEFEQAVSFHVGYLDNMDAYYDMYIAGKPGPWVYYNTDYDIIRFLITEDLADDYAEELEKARKIGDVEYLLIDSMDGDVVGKSVEKRELNFACNSGGDVYCRNCGEPWDRMHLVDELAEGNSGFDQVELTQPSDDPHGEDFIQLKAVGACPCCKNSFN